MTAVNWSTERVEQLKALWAEGLSCSQIARTLGGITRNAVIGKVHRLGLHTRGDVQGRVPQVRPRQTRPQYVSTKTTTLPKIRELPIEPLRMDDGGLITPLNAAPKNCRWPHGEVGTEEFHYCGHPCQAGSSFCEPHHAKVWVPNPKKKDAA